MFRNRKDAHNVVARMSRAQQRERREHPDVLSITVPKIDGQSAFELTVKRPLTEREDLVIPLDMVLVEKVIVYIRNGGFDRSLKRSADMPPIVHIRKDCKYKYQYSYTDQNTGKRSKHFASTLGGALRGLVEGPHGDEVGDDDVADHDGGDNVEQYMAECESSEPMG